MKKLKRIGILTGGGDCPGLNAVIRAVVKTTCLKYDAEVYGIIDGYSGLIDGKLKKLYLNDVSGILSRGGTILGTSNRHNPFKYPQKKGGRKKYIDVSDRVIKNINQNKIEVLITVGGDGTQAIANELFSKYNVPLVGIPKTIDNDLNGTDITIGFDTALSIATSSIDKIHSTAESHHRVMVIEVMGRYAGWIALESGIAGGGDVILIPEIPFKMEKITEKIIQRARSGKRFSLVVVAEGAKPEGGELFVSRKIEDPNDPLRLGGISNYVGNQIEDITGIETRYTILGHVQRGGSPTSFDRILGTRLGYQAVEFAQKGIFGHLVGIRGQNIITTPIKEAIAVPRRVNPESDYIKTAEALGTSFGI